RLPIWIEDVINPGIELISVDDRKRRKSCTIRDAKLVIDVTEVNLHGTLGEIKLPGYPLVRVSLAQRDDDLPLAWGQCLHELLALHSTPRFALHRSVDDHSRPPATCRTQSAKLSGAISLSMMPFAPRVIAVKIWLSVATAVRNITFV